MVVVARNEEKLKEVVEEMKVRIANISLKYIFH